MHGGRFSKTAISLPSESKKGQRAENYEIFIA